MAEKLCLPGPVKSRPQPQAPSGVPRDTPYNASVSIDLIRAIRQGNAAEVRRILDAGADTNWRLPAEDDHGAFLDQTTPLMVAAAAPGSNAAIVRLLLERGADPFAVSAGETSAIWYACGGGSGYPLTSANLADLEPDHVYRNWGGGDAERLKLLLDAGSDPNESADNGRSCVYEACSVGDPERLRLLIERGARVGPTAPAASVAEGLTEVLGGDMTDTLRSAISCAFHQLVPLFAAASSGSVECVRLIVESGFPADYKVGGDNAFGSLGSLEVAEYLWSLGVRPSEGSFGFDAIDDAIEAGNLPVLRFLLREAEPSFIQDKLLMASGVRMNPRAVEVLLELGADANQVSKAYGSPLHYACWQGDGNGGRENEAVEQTVQLLIDAGADPNLMAKGLKPLHEAVFGDWGSPTSVRVLLRNGADVDGLDANGQTALMVAAQHGEAECVRHLLEAGANRTLKDRAGKTALDYARAHAKIWRKPRFNFLARGAAKMFGSLGLDYDEVSSRARSEAEKVLELLGA